EAINATLGLDGFDVLGASVVPDGIELVVESSIDAGSCKACGGIAAEPKERPQVLVRDLPISGRPVMLRWIKRRWRCGYCAATWTESHPEIPPRARMTERFKAHLAQRAIYERNFSQVARTESVSYETVARAHRCRAELLEATRRRPPIAILAIDEAAIRKGHHYCTVISDPVHRYVVDSLPGRGGVCLVEWLSQLPTEAKDNLQAVVLDMFGPFHLAIAAALPHIPRVADKFHVLRNVNLALDRQRSRLQGRGHKIGARKRLFRRRFLLLRALDSLTVVDRHRLDEVLLEHPELARGWHLKEGFRLVYGAPSRDVAERMLEDWFELAVDSGIPEFEKLARNLSGWRPELLAYFDHRVTNGYAEGITNRIKTIKRQAYGVPTFDSFRRRILVECGMPKVGIPA
ncbi:MAG: ISL3 family transposase, partial [Actinobacteria bacterium]|nr:ISL3 family transposase [Actinomycetota bacterium]